MPGNTQVRVKYPTSTSMVYATSTTTTECIRFRIQSVLKMEPRLNAQDSSMLRFSRCGWMNCAGYNWGYSNWKVKNRRLYTMSIMAGLLERYCWSIRRYDICVPNVIVRGEQ